MSGIEGNCKWHFAESNTKYGQGPMDAKSLNFNKTPYESLVRESIQNSIDAAVSDDTPVIVSFKFMKASSDNFPELFNIDKYINGCLEKFDTLPCKKKYEPMLDYLRNAREEKLDYLEVSDENTKGMPYRAGDTGCPFYGFVMSAGNPVHNTEDTGGAYGIGKAAYFNLSKISTVMVSTMVNEDEHYFEGIASLSSSIVGGKHREPIGFYTENSNEEPVAKASSIPTRFRRKAVGTSMFIMGLGLNDSSLLGAKKEIIAAAVKHFWFAILSGRLQVQIGDAKEIETIINSDNIVEITAKLFDSFQDKKRGHSNSRPYIDAVLNAGTDEKHLHYEEDLPTLGHVDLYLLKEKKGTDNILYMRKTRMLIKYEKNGTNYGFYGVFFCPDKGNAILRNMENPAHNEWDPNNCGRPEDKDDAIKAAFEIKEFINSCIKNAFSDEEKDFLTFGGLDEFLAIPSSMDEDESEYKGNNGEPSGDTIEEETGSSTTDVDDGGIREKKQPSQGKVTIIKKTSASRKNNKEQSGNTVYTGNTDRTRDSKCGGEPGTKNPSNPFEENEDDGTEGSYAEPLEVQYRSYALLEEGLYEHYIVIHSNKEVEAQVTVLSGGENSEDVIDIVASDKGEPIGNNVANVPLVIGKNILRIRFADGMRHAVKVDINENK